MRSLVQEMVRSFSAVRLLGFFHSEKNNAFMKPFLCPWTDSFIFFIFFSFFLFFKKKFNFFLEKLFNFFSHFNPFLFLFFLFFRLDVVCRGWRITGWRSANWREIISYRASRLNGRMCSSAHPKSGILSRDGLGNGSTPSWSGSWFL